MFLTVKKAWGAIYSSSENLLHLTKQNLVFGWNGPQISPLNTYPKTLVCSSPCSERNWFMCSGSQDWHVSPKVPYGLDCGSLERCKILHCKIYSVILRGKVNQLVFFLPPPQENAKLLQARGVAYINADSSVEGVCLCFYGSGRWEVDEIETTSLEAQCWLCHGPWEKCIVGLAQEQLGREMVTQSYNYPLASGREYIMLGI